MRLKIMGAGGALPKELMLVFPSRLLFRVGRGEGSDCARALQAGQQHRAGQDLAQEPLHTQHLILTYSACNF